MKFTIKEIRFKDYKSFKGDYISLKPEKFTLLIGRNNCGKSSIIDVFESITSPSFFHKHRCSILIDINGQKVRNEPFSGYKEYIGDKTYRIEPMNNTFRCNLLEGNYQTSIIDAEPHISNFLQQISFRRLNADRDIIPEGYNSDYHLDENGNGACNLINQILTKEQLPEKLIQKNLLEALN